MVQNNYIIRPKLKFESYASESGDIFSSVIFDRLISIFSSLFYFIIIIIFFIREVS